MNSTRNELRALLAEAGVRGREAWSAFAAECGVPYPTLRGWLYTQRRPRYGEGTKVKEVLVATICRYVPPGRKRERLLAKAGMLWRAA